MFTEEAKEATTIFDVLIDAGYYVRKVNRLGDVDSDYLDEDEDEDIELLPREDIAAVLVDWYTDTLRARPADDELRRTAARCEAQERPLDPADVRDWADYWLTL